MVWIVCVRNCSVSSSMLKVMMVFGNYSGVLLEVDIWLCV